MANQSVREILGEVAAFHRRLSDLYRRNADQEGRERLRMLLFYLSRHEAHLGEALARFQSGGGRVVLEMWVPMKTIEHVIEELRGVQIAPGLEVETLIGRALDFDNKVIAFYHLLAEKAPDNAVRQLFQTLIRLEQRAETVLARDTEELSDL